MPYKIFKGEKLYFTKYVPYFGPITLMLCPPNTILHLFNKYIVDIDNKYYELLEVRYLDKDYKIADFIEIYPSAVGISND